jgi:di/tricarboxylate transporter
MLSVQEWLLIAVTAAALALIVSNRMRPDLVALLVLATLPLLGVVTFQEAFSGFSRSVVITIIGLFIVTQALEDTGVVKWLADRMRRIGRGSEVRLLLLFMSAGALLSLVMNNIAAGAVLLPAAVQVGSESRVPPSKLLMPLAFGTLVGGMATYFTTANIILSSILRDQQQPPLSMADFLPTGGLIVVATLIFMATIGRFLLPRRSSVGQSISPLALSRSLYETYGLNEQMWEATIAPDSPLVGVELGASKIGLELGLTVLAIWRGHQAILTPLPTEVLQADDYLLVLGPEERLEPLQQRGAHIGRSNGGPQPSDENYVDLTEVLIPPRSSLEGNSLTELSFRNKYQLTAVALWREGRSYCTDVGKMPLEVGDALLMVGTPQKIKALTRDPDFLVLRSSHAAQPPLPHKASWALGITIAVILASIFEVVPSSEAMIIGVAAMALTGCINLDEAYRGISWRVIFLIAGMLPISLAMINTGLADHLGTVIVTSLAPFGPLGLVSGLFLITMVATQVIGGQVAALIIGPIAVTAAVQVGVDAQAVAVAVAIACSAAFLTPLAHPVNVLMMGPGGYLPRDFLNVGSGMIVVTFITLLIGMRLFWGIH